MFLTESCCSEDLIESNRLKVEEIAFQKPRSDLNAIHHEVIKTKFREVVLSSSKTALKVTSCVHLSTETQKNIKRLMPLHHNPKKGEISTRIYSNSTSTVSVAHYVCKLLNRNKYSNLKKKENSDWHNNTFGATKLCIIYFFAWFFKCDCISRYGIFTRFWKRA